ncbi:hypothetical protein NPIL_359051 [Nephila pilipes]|uniref:Secreted protein n=1 Tax=Nephila pilipes TaxID=299642 RepID=A0A8X6MVU7_NEPPI|nr:hypothetical protein NPIL_359051 [Nephila pilipes]
MCLNECLYLFLWALTSFVSDCCGWPPRTRLGASPLSLPQKLSGEAYSRSNDCSEAFLPWSVAPCGVSVPFPAVLLESASSSSSASVGFPSAF